MTPIVEEFRLFASHHQFYVQDSDPIGSMGDPSFWSPESEITRLAKVEGILGIATGSYDEVKVRVEQHFEEPSVDLTAWDHVIETGLNMRSRILLVYGCIAPSGVFFFVEQRHYRVRCCHANLAASADCTREAGDWYLVQFWPGEPQETQILKQWSGATRP
jgi:hypothetical protein